VADKKAIAIVLDDNVYSAPNVQNEISGGVSSISGGNFTLEDTKDLANVLKAGRLPAPARIIGEEVVGPSLGQEAISAGLLSCIGFSSYPYLHDSLLQTRRYCCCNSGIDQRILPDGCIS
jgi:preprotein translocase subunit SecD